MAKKESSTKGTQKNRFDQETKSSEEQIQEVTCCIIACKSPYNLVYPFLLIDTLTKNTVKLASDYVDTEVMVAFEAECDHIVKQQDLMKLDGTIDKRI